MFKTAFSTVACPDWTLGSVAQAAAQWGYDGVELRTFGYGSTEFACDPALTSAEKVRAMFREQGVEPAIVASGVSFDEAVTPPVIGFAIKDTERTVRAAKGVIDLASQTHSPFVRVFGFQIPGREKRARAVNRIAGRLMLAIDAARNTGVRVVLENGGSFPTAASLLEITSQIRSPLLGVSYSGAVAADAGENPADGAALLGDRLWVVKLKDRCADGRPCVIGDGQMGVPEFVRSLRDRGFSGWAVVEWDRAWLPGLEAPQAVLPESVRRLYQWAGSSQIRIHRVNAAAAARA